MMRVLLLVMIRWGIVCLSLGMGGLGFAASPSATPLTVDVIPVSHPAHPTVLPEANRSFSSTLATKAGCSGNSGSPGITLSQPSYTRHDPKMEASIIYSVLAPKIKWTRIVDFV